MEKEKQKTKKDLKKFFLQLIKFGLVGMANTLVDFGVLNLLMWLSKTYSGNWIILLNGISFSAAVINSYFLNKFWTFQNKEKRVATQFFKFLVVSLVGLFINTVIVYLGTTFIKPFFGLNEGLWANLIKVMATGVAMFWNFVGYKLWAFKSRESK